MKNKLVIQFIQSIAGLTSSNITMKLLLRRSVLTQLFIAAVGCCISLTACEKNIDIKIDNNEPLLVVEAYINNQMRDYNYVALSRSLDYFSTDFQGAAVSNATVTVTEGEIINQQYVWNRSSKVQLLEANIPAVPANFRKGVYFDPRLVTNSQGALIGVPGKSYLLEISDGQQQYTATTTLLPPLPIDSLTVGFSYRDTDDNNKLKARITNHYKDPDTLNNTQFYYYRFSENRNNFGWGGISRSRAFGVDDVTNGQQLHLTHPRGFVVGDTVNYYMASVTRDVYNFWDSYSKARNNNGPFSTPVTLMSNVKGDNVTGCFTGLSLTSKTVIIK
ncbi:DUF4249 domain-containing protein [Segetibacter aerophilus]|uniref:DUF4249 domain-containing protein n=1 Tax=Segetibacter aerophilus TaxID=670293 RepID=A0A512B7C3_9BACT|nr:DUF4249 domain-containing protein [Segetibacter aerophilus]GEO07697.1 hypothetical protein SAE01_01930 [Segetibacter aerophilus]